ncbi:unnamed protein product [Caenorhabditis angaria]|uniref:Uncharacterized protein n=1 Tax=Caenorhabditis angaria TaxID=860376 RepID=A0A9P1IZP1_9PELO|nr:unnamed protein product [Caenorhabditis angaria]
MKLLCLLIFSLFFFEIICPPPIRFIQTTTKTPVTKDRSDYKLKSIGFERRDSNIANALWFDLQVLLATIPFEQLEKEVQRLREKIRQVAVEQYKMKPV